MQQYITDKNIKRLVALLLAIVAIYAYATGRIQLETLEAFLAGLGFPLAYRGDWKKPEDPLDVELDDGDDK